MGTTRGTGSKRCFLLVSRIFGAFGGRRMAGADNCVTVSGCLAFSLRVRWDRFSLTLTLTLNPGIPEMPILNPHHANCSPPKTTPRDTNTSVGGPDAIDMV